MKNSIGNPAELWSYDHVRHYQFICSGSFIASGNRAHATSELRRE
jgi:hypothetical protein